MDAAEDYMRTRQKGGQTSIEQISWVRPVISNSDTCSTLHSIPCAELRASRSCRLAGALLTGQAHSATRRCSGHLVLSMMTKGSLLEIVCLLGSSAHILRALHLLLRAGSAGVAGIRRASGGGVHRPSQGVR